MPLRSHHIQETEYATDDFLCPQGIPLSGYLFSSSIIQVCACELSFRDSSCSVIRSSFARSCSLSALSALRKEKAHRATLIFHGIHIIFPFLIFAAHVMEVHQVIKPVHSCNVQHSTSSFSTRSFKPS